MALPPEKENDMIAEPITPGVAFSSVGRESVALDGLVHKLGAGAGIEELLLADTRVQRRAGQALRKARRERRKQLVEQAAAKIKKAASCRLTSAVFSTLVQVAVAFDRLVAMESLAERLGEKQAQAFFQGEEALAGLLPKLMPWEFEATGHDADAKLLQQAADSAGDAARDTDAWIASAKELERRMVSHLEQASAAEHRARMDVIGKMA
jgi:hypothetical protein